ncbi:hypothetical protein [Lederbergia panacisoli]|uniref:hypothetical protein n=1 Tax=Lederbergia panacisoli TaxID=1255251 RepID=UPI00214B844D|nr:hypothetical protein [Lederbergia panacisoli]MCR2823542.1 hypothetical protein [Lederbergia panacisoli]
MDSVKKREIRNIIDYFNKTGPIWKSSASFHYGHIHLEKRKRRKEIPNDWTLKDYNNLILKVMNDRENDIHIYVMNDFFQEYFVFDDGKWMVIVGENKIMETCMFRKSTSSYLRRENGYTYLGRVREVFE